MRKKPTKTTSQYDAEIAGTRRVIAVHIDIGERLRARWAGSPIAEIMERQNVAYLSNLETSLKESEAGRRAA
jgi:hypothetical protein